MIASESQNDIPTIPQNNMAAAGLPATGVLAVWLGLGEVWFVWFSDVHSNSILPNIAGISVFPARIFLGNSLPGLDSQKWITIPSSADTTFNRISMEHMRLRRGDIALCWSQLIMQHTISCRNAAGCLPQAVARQLFHITLQVKIPNESLADQDSLQILRGLY